MEHRTPRLVEIDDEAADEVFDALSSRTARTMFAALHDGPATASDLAELADTSLQNVRYHLDKLAAAGLVEIVDTWYSEQGREMKVYAPVSSSLVMLSGDGPPETTLRNLLKHLVSGIGVLAIASVLFDRGLALVTPSNGRIVSTSANRTTVTKTVVATSRTVSGDGGAPTPTPKVKTVVVERTVVNGSPANGTLSTPVAGLGRRGMTIDIFGVGVPPGAIFFVGGLFVLLLALWWYHRRLRRFAT